MSNTSDASHWWKADVCWANRSRFNQREKMFIKLMRQIRSATDPQLKWLDELYKHVRPH